MDVKYTDLKNKRVFITGGGSGIGASIVEHFCKQGSEVYFVDINLKETKKLLNKLKKKKFRAPTFIECNLLDNNALYGYESQKDFYHLTDLNIFKKLEDL